MADEIDPAPDGAGQNGRDPNTDRELQRARADAKRYREEINALREDVARLHKEAEGHRGRAKQLEGELNAAKEDRLRFEGETKAEHEKRIAELDAEAKKRLTLAELKAEAIKAGIRDTRGLNLLDLSRAELADDGSIKLPEGFFDKAKEDMPWLFGDMKPPVTSATTAKPPAQEPVRIKKATEMSDAEAAALEAKILRGERADLAA